MFSTLGVEPYAEYFYLDNATSTNENILWLHVPVDDPVGMEIMQCLDLQCNHKRKIDK